MSYFPQRTFNGVPGEPSTDLGGPDELEKNIDDINAMFNPNATHSDGVTPGGITQENMASGVMSAVNITIEAITGLIGNTVQAVVQSLKNLVDSNKASSDAALANRYTKAEVDAMIAGSGVSSFNGRSGAVTPQSGDYTAAQVGALPSGNVSGTNGYLAKFTGSKNIANGPQLGSDTTKFLRNDGQWAVPPGSGGGGGGRNLADNGWFSINQRNLTSGTIASSATGSYILDRWIFTNTGASNTSYSLSQGILTLNASNISTGSLYISQYIPQLQDGSLTGRKITGSVMFSDGTVQSGTITKQAGTRQSLIGTNTSDFELFINATEWFRFRVNAGKTAAIKAIKLEVGESSSLDKDTSPNYIEELEKCCYYFERVKAANSNLTIGIGATDTTGQTLYLPLRVRIKNNSVSSTLSLSGSIRYGVDNLSNIASNWQAGNYSAEMGYYQIMAYGSSAFVGQAPYRVGISANGYLDISAEPMIS